MANRSASAKSGLIESLSVGGSVHAWVTTSGFSEFVVTIVATHSTLPSAGSMGLVTRSLNHLALSSFANTRVFVAWTSPTLLAHEGLPLPSCSGPAAFTTTVQSGAASGTRPRAASALPGWG